MALLDPKDWCALRGGPAAALEPATGEALAELTLAAPADVADAAIAAAAAQRDWARRPYTERAAVLRRAGDLVHRHAEEIGEWLVREAGSVRGKAGFEIRTAAEECYEAAALAHRPLGQVLPSGAPRLSYTTRVPAGVVGVIAPFNVPLVLAVRSVAPALALGNAVVLKPDPRTAVCGGHVLAAVLAEAGLPEGLLHVLPGGADVGRTLVEDPRVRMISFTGSTAAGRSVGALAAQHLKRAHLELGGNSAFLVLPDADLDAAMSTAAWASFFHQGQVCMTAGRHLVHASLYDEYVARLAAKADALTVGDPFRAQVHLGPVIDRGQLDRIDALVRESAAAGVRIAAGGTHEELFYRPTVLADAGPDAGGPGSVGASPAYGEEVFGPVAPVRAFRTLDEAVALANESPYGLALGVVTRDAARALELADRIPTGLLHINDQTVNDEPVAAFGGLADSGTGARFGGEANLDAFTETRWTTVRATPAAYPF
ncbi:aldehyde dehydrogenase family protein (plasmid) [Streptomyces sp. BHT-5-2]|uniref:aldehyde dehydrogenase family protein n=1 Tax=unclassified Streptomyces TaxID=2593676 RepID=UPI001C8E9D5A|nr:aldehyde dehydrogenase family protein [Streptomyces sp. BHT-5-2]QZL08423.1 aldehyde dehydrogenase family protein [Streptomyces sp. BHT-5-2]